MQQSSTKVGVRLESTNTSWIDTLVCFSQQLQLLISSSWNMSFYIMSVLSNVDQLERIREVVDQFNGIVLDPTHNLIQTLGDNVTMYVDTTNNRAYMDCGISGTCIGSEFELTDQVRLSLMYGQTRYTLVKERHECNGMYVFVMHTPSACSDDMEQVLINGTVSRIRLESVRNMDQFGYTSDLGVSVSSYDTAGNYIKLSARSEIEYSRNVQFITDWQAQIVLNGSLVPFITRLSAFSLEDMSKKTKFVYISSDIEHDETTDVDTA